MKSFASTAFVAVFASAQEGTAYWGTGVSRFNAQVYNLYTSDSDSTKLDLHTYYKDDKGRDEFHLDLILYFPDADFDPYIEFAFCFAVDGTTTWDCMQTRTNIDVAALATEVDEDSYDTTEEFDVKDMHQDVGDTNTDNFDAIALQKTSISTDDGTQDWS